MLGLLDSMIAIITPEMPGQIAKWGGTLTGWQTNVQILRDYIVARCDSITEGLKDCYSLTGPFNVIYEVDPVGAGHIQVNSLLLTSFPWAGTYYGGIPTSLTAIATDPALEFDHWEITNTPLPSVNDSAVTVEYTTSQTVTAVFKANTDIIVPTAFSPNGDGVNDIVRAYGEGIKTISFTIWDRWGERIFSTSDFDGYYTAGWDGNYKGKKMPAGVYAYQVVATMVDNSEVKKGGNITLMR
jgi:gliding motility-associated-like protein